VRSSAFFVVPAVCAFGAAAHAHEPDNPDAHRSMPNQVTAGVTPVCAAHYGGRHPILGYGPNGEIVADSALCAGVSITLAREIGRFFEIRGRFSYDKPLSFNEGITEGLHELRGTISPGLVAYREDDDLTITLGPEIGVLGAILTRVEVGAREVEPVRAAGWTAGLVAAIRPWITYHTGIFVELGAGAAGISSDALELRSRWLGRLTIGWADRF
jgi:hypothetical protein